MRKAGTSFATPIAAGIAATLLHYAKVKFPECDGSNRFGNVGKMREMLSKIADKRSNYVPASFFEANSDGLVYETLYDQWIKND